MNKNDRERCSWATTDFYKEYHDKNTMTKNGENQFMMMENYLRCGFLKVCRLDYRG